MTPNEERRVDFIINMLNGNKEELDNLEHKSTELLLELKQYTNDLQLIKYNRIKEIINSPTLRNYKDLNDQLIESLYSIIFSEDAVRVITKDQLVEVLRINGRYNKFKTSINDTIISLLPYINKEEE